MYQTMKEVLSFGAGVQSTTLLLMSCEGILPKLDHVIFADTQWEPAAVYRHLEWCKEHAAKHGITIDVRTAGNLRKDLLEFWGPGRASADGKRHASIPAFIKNPDGSRGMVRRQCTGTYKIDVIEKYVRQEVFGLKKGERWPVPMLRVPDKHSPEGFRILEKDWFKESIYAKGAVDLPFECVRQWIGISQDETQRMKNSTRPAVVYWHPLVEAEHLTSVRPGSMFPKGMRRRDCVEWLESRGVNAPRSACIGCPFRHKAEWQALTREEFDDACEVDRLIRRSESLRLESIGKNELIGQPYLHSSLVALDEADLGRDEFGLGVETECTGGCGT